MAIPVVEFLIQGYKNPIDFCIKVKCSKEFFDISQDGMMASQQNLGQFLQNKLFLVSLD